MCINPTRCTFGALNAAEYTPPAEGGYTPSEDTVRLTNAINRGLERPEHPEDVVALILRGISARYT